MTRPLRVFSDQLFNGSDSRGEHVACRLAQTSPQPPARPASARTVAAWLTGGEIQTLRASRLSLRPRTWSRSQELSVDQHDRTAATGRLCAERLPRRSRRVAQQLPQGTRGAQRDLCDQHRTSAATRELRLNGPGRRCPRPRQGGRHPRQHDRMLSCRRRPAVRHGGSRS